MDLSVAAAVPLYGRYDWLTSEGPGRRELIALIERYIVQRRIGEALEVFRAAGWKACIVMPSAA